MRAEELVLELAVEAGFDLAGITPLAPPPDAARFDRWLAAGHQADMDYLERQRERIVEPRRILPAGRSILVVGMAHSRPEVALADGARVARYAAGRDYHNVLGKKLRKLARRLAGEGLIERGRIIVDAGPLMERSHAAAAGIGFASKAANLLHPRFGPWFFLGELILETELEPTGSGFMGSCGSCTACLDACPTDAFVEPGVVDSKRCISYQTIENRGLVPSELQAAIGSWAFGCDVCSEVCPWGAKAPDLGERFGVHPGLAEAGLVSWLAPHDHAARWNGSPLRRPKRDGLARNAAIVLGNLPSEAGHSALLRVLNEDASELVRTTAAQALARGFGERPATRTALDDALRSAADASRAELARARAACDR